MKCLNIGDPMSRSKCPLSAVTQKYFMDEEKTKQNKNSFSILFAFLLRIISRIITLAVLAW